ncbi:MAG: hypothetical protein GTN74_03665 [Proteobacteria bacterium]|nr:hypothetical protein [Pseudomonadota bacterium]NIS68389.1 hypothetical protein [Pseudomonadota bacterium]
MEFYESRQDEGEKNAAFTFLTDVNAAMGVAGVGDGEYTGGITREVQIDILTLRNWFAHFGVRETSLFDPSPTQFDHELEYLGIGYEAAHGRIKIFWDHICHNASRKLPQEKRNGIHWNELGVGYVSTGMRLGHKNDGIRFDPGSEWLNKINWRASLSKIWMRTENRYEWILKFSLRDDVFRIGSHIIFAQIGVDSIYDERGVTPSASLKIGNRIRVDEGVYLIPFVSLEHFHDWYSLDQGEDFFSAGLSLEMGLDCDGAEYVSDREKPKIRWTPKLHINGGYAKILDDEDYGYSSDVSIDLDFFKLGSDKTLSLDTYAGILTLPHDLNPYIVRYKVGPSLRIDLDDLDLKLFHSYSSLYGLEDEGVIRDYNHLGLELKNGGASHWNWHVRAGAYPSTKDFEFWGDLEGSLGYDLYAQGITPYVSGSGHYLQGNSSLFGHEIEAGIKIPGKMGSLRLYLRHQDDFDVFRFGRGTQTLLGFRISV